MDPEVEKELLPDVQKIWQLSYALIKSKAQGFSEIHEYTLRVCAVINRACSNRDALVFLTRESRSTARIARYLSSERSSSRHYFNRRHGFWHVKHANGKEVWLVPQSSIENLIGFHLKILCSWFLNTY